MMIELATATGVELPNWITEAGVVGVLVWMILREVLPHVTGAKRDQAERFEQLNAMADLVADIHAQFEGVNVRKWRAEDAELRAWHEVRDPSTGAFVWQRPTCSALVHDRLHEVDLKLADIERRVSGIPELKDSVDSVRRCVDRLKDIIERKD